MDSLNVDSGYYPLSIFHYPLTQKYVASLGKLGFGVKNYPLSIICCLSQKGKHKNFVSLHFT